MSASGFKKLCLVLGIGLFCSAAISKNCPQEQATYQRAKNLFESGHYLLSATHFSMLSTSRCDKELAAEALFSYALCMSELGEIQEAVKVLGEISERKFRSVQDKAGLFRAYLQTENITYPNKQARNRIELWEHRSQQEQFRFKLKESLLGDSRKKELLSLQADLIKAPSKAPWLAGVSSAIVPGLGQAYVGAWQSAAVALILNVLFVATTVEFIDRDMWAAASASGLVFSVVYFGNIISAVQGANTYNFTRTRPHELNLKISLFPEFSP